MVINDAPDLSQVFAPRNRNGAAQMALACVAYAAIPYLGILFCPVALVFGGIGLARSYSRPEQGGRSAAGAGMALAVGLFAYQIALWWLLYQAPKWAVNQ